MAALKLKRLLRKATPMQAMALMLLTTAKLLMVMPLTALRTMQISARMLPSTKTNNLAVQSPQRSCTALYRGVAKW